MMPGLNRQGPPFGDGNQSGRRMGKCNPEVKKNEIPQSAFGMGRRWKNRIESKNENLQEGFRGKGFGRGMGRGLGRGAQWDQNSSQD